MKPHVLWKIRSYCISSNISTFYVHAIAKFPSVDSHASVMFVTFFLFSSSAFVANKRFDEILRRGSDSQQWFSHTRRVKPVASFSTPFDILCDKNISRSNYCRMLQLNRTQRSALRYKCCCNCNRPIICNHDRHCGILMKHALAPRHFLPSYHTIHAGKDVRNS